MNAGAAASGQQDDPRATGHPGWPTTTRGFFGRGRAARDPRLPRGSTTPATTGRCCTPRQPADRHRSLTFTVEGLVERETTWTWDEIHALPRSRYAGDIHCVTTWSKLGMTFDGVSVDTLLAAAGPLPTATHVVASRTRVHHQPAADRRHRRQAWVSGTRTGARSPSSTAAGRLLVPPCTSGRAPSGSPDCACSTTRAGFLERNGYHDRGDPWTEQRYQGD